MCLYLLCEEAYMQLHGSIYIKKCRFLFLFYFIVKNGIIIGGIDLVVLLRIRSKMYKNVLEHD